MVKKRPKSRPVRVSGASSTPRDSSAGDSVADVIFSAQAHLPEAAPPLLKVCRLCETKDGPFLNIFDADKVTAKRIDEVLPFTVAEKDELPDKICFRCSAKLEELYEFILKCIKTQENLRTAIGKKAPLETKSKFRVYRAQWEQKLNKKNISNDDTCKALIKIAIEGLKNVPLNLQHVEDESKETLSNKVKNGTETPVIQRKDSSNVPSKSGTISDARCKMQIIQDDADLEDAKLKQQVKLSIEKCDEKVPMTRSTRSTTSTVLDETKKVKICSTRHRKIEPEQALHQIKVDDKNKQTNDGKVDNVKESKKSDVPAVTEAPKEPPPKAPEPPPINIMDHVSIIKVNSVGTLFLCKLCNRNFLKKELVLTHGCAKNNVPKDKFLHNVPPPPEVPKPCTVKYIKINQDFRRPVVPPITPIPIVPENKTIEKKSSDAIKVNIPVQAETKPKPKIGPASKVKNLSRTPEIPKETIPPTSQPATQEKIVPEVKFPNMPSLNSRYKLVPGPNNTFTLIEDKAKLDNDATQLLSTAGPKSKRKRKMPVEVKDDSNQPKPVPDNVPGSPEVIELDDFSPPPVTEQPYPVGLFQTPHHSGGFASALPKPPTFTTPAMKKQSYTVVQTGNPSKLLISTKPQPVVEDVQRKKMKKSKTEAVQNAVEPFQESADNHSQTKDAGFFTFINVDPLLQPSYVLPTDNIIQESQISTSTPASKPAGGSKDKNSYSCNMCDESFSREKKLLGHIQSHFNQMDEEDQLRKEKTAPPGPKRKTRKS